MRSTMIIEYIRYDIAEDQRAAFVAAYADAAAELRAAGQCLRYEIAQGVEEPGHFVVRLEWDSLEGHETGFRKGPQFPEFFRKVKPFFGNIQEMKHYRETDVVWARA